MTRIAFIQIDCNDAERLATFWSCLLGTDVQERIGNYVCLQPAYVDGPGLCFQVVPEPKITKNRLHLDIAVLDIDTAATHVKSLGGTQVSPHDVEEHGWRYRVMADLEGNEFCLIS